MDTLNQYENRLRTKMTKAREGGRTTAETEKFSAGSNVFVEVVTPVPDYKYSFTVTAADNDPNTTAPSAARVWDLKGFMSLSGYGVFTGGTTPTASLELWALDETNGNWFLVGAASGLSGFEEFYLEDKARQRVVFLRVSALTGTPTNITVYASAE